MDVFIADYHPDLGLECAAYHVSSRVPQHWRGVSFEDARFTRSLAHDNKLYVSLSLSELRNTDVRFAGVGADGGVTAALQARGVPPKIDGLAVQYSAYHGLNFTRPTAPIRILNANITNNAGNKKSHS